MATSAPQFACRINDEHLNRLRQPPVIPAKLLLGPGPTNLSPSVHEALGQWSTLGHLHPEFCSVMDDVRVGLQYLFGTDNRLTFCISGTGHAGMEAAMINMIEPGTRVVVCQNGIWGARASHLARVMGADVLTIKVDAGRAFTVDEVTAAINSHHAKLLFVCYGESSTGVLQPLAGLGDACRAANCLFLVDTVAALGAAPFDMDALKVDIVYSASQKALSAPTGLAPISFNERAWNHYTARAVPVPSFYFDLRGLANYWGCLDEPRTYHHTAPIQLVYGLRAALTLVVVEGREQCVQRHVRNAQRLVHGLQARGLRPFVAEADWRNPAITTVAVPETIGANWKAVNDHLMNEHRIEIAGGLGDTVGKVWRIGLMGQNSREENVDRVLNAIDEAVKKCRL